jgi:uncharacterized membrane protein YbaN (DUF454 family)
MYLDTQQPRAEKPQSSRRSRFARVAGIIVGWAFVVLGIVGLFLPVLQGILFLVIGLLILSREYSWARNLISYFRKRFPKFDAILKIVHEKYGHLIGHKEHSAG